jgi:hypothetical protein
MNGPMLLEFVLWSCFALSLVVLAPLGYGIYDISEASGDEWPKFTSIVAGLLAAMALPAEPRHRVHHVRPRRLSDATRSALH